FATRVPLAYATLSGLFRLAFVLLRGPQAWPKLRSSILGDPRRSFFTQKASRQAQITLLPRKTASLRPFARRSETRRPAKAREIHDGLGPESMASLVGAPRGRRRRRLHEVCERART